MDDRTNINKLKEKIKKFCEDRDWDQFHNAKELAIGMVTEASELLQHFRFKSEKQVDEMFQNESKRQQISEEIADTLYFIILLSQKYNVDLTTELNKKIQKNKEKYPINKVKGLNKKYNELESC